MTAPKIDWSAWAVRAKTDRDVRQWFVIANEPLCRHFANKFRHSLDLDDAMQAARIGVNRAIDKFDPSKGAWSTYAQQWVRAEVSQARSQVPTVSGFRRILAMGRELGKTQRAAYAALSTDADIDGSNREDWESKMLEPFVEESNVDDLRLWREAFKSTRLTAREGQIFDLLFRGHKPAEVARAIGVSRQRVQQIEATVGAKVRRAARRCA